MVSSTGSPRGSGDGGCGSSVLRYRARTTPYAFVKAVARPSGATSRMRAVTSVSGAVDSIQRCAKNLPGDFRVAIERRARKRQHVPTGARRPPVARPNR